MNTRKLTASLLLLWALFCSSVFSATQPIAISEDELASAILAPLALAGAPIVFNRIDILTMNGVSLEYSWADFSGDTLRIHDILIGNDVLWADFRYDGAQHFGYIQSGAGRGEMVNRPEIPGLDSSSAITSLYGPPFSISVQPLGSLNEDYIITLSEFSPQALIFKLTSVQTISKAASDNLRSNKLVVSRAMSKAVSAGTIDAYIEEYGRVDITLPSVADWTDAMLGCLSVGIDALKVGTTGQEIVKILARDSPTALKDAYESAVLGNPKEASLILSELAFKGLAAKAKDRGQLGAFLNALAEKSDYGKALAKGAGACTVDYKEAGRIVLGGLAGAAFPLGACAASAMMEASKELRGLVANALVKKVYAKYKTDNDPVVDWSITGYGHPLITQYALQKGIDTARAERELNTLFSQWKARETQVSPIRERLLQLKTRWGQDKIWLEAGIRLSLPTDATEADVFAVYVSKINATRARLTAFNATQQDLDVGAGLLLRQAYLRGTTSIPFDLLGWKKGMAVALQTYAAGLFKSEPAICSVEPVVEKAWVLVNVTDFNGPATAPATLSYARGNIVWRVTADKEIFGFKSTWSTPPTIIRSTDEVTVDISIAVTENAAVSFSFSGYFWIYFDFPWITPGYASYVTEFSSAAGENGKLYVYSTIDKVGAGMSRRVSVKASNLKYGTAVGTQMALLTLSYNGQGAGTRYTYEWREVK